MLAKATRISLPKGRWFTKSLLGKHSSVEMLI